MFDADYYESLLNGLHDRSSTRMNSGMEPEDAIVRTLTDDFVIPELMDEGVTRSIAEHGHSDADDEIARAWSQRYVELDDSDPKQAFFAGRAFHVLFQDVQKRLYEGTDN